MTSTTAATTMSNVRIVARIRPLLNSEMEKDVVVHAESNSVTMPNPKNDSEIFTFPFNCVYGRDADQAQLFTEVSPTLKHLFKGNDVTIFAYGATGSGKTYSMRGNKSPAERGIIPRMLTAIYRRGKELEKKSNGDVKMTAIMSYYEIYNDRVFDLFEPPEKRTPAGLPLREHHGKTIVVGLSEKEINSLKEFETLYDRANANRSTSATKLNAHSSRSHAIVCVRVVLDNKAAGETRTGMVSCIDLAGSEDNRRTANDKERMTESASINKSLFVLAQCVEAMTKKQNRIPYRESKMTRILSLGQNNSMTVMILNLAPTKPYHQDTLSALNFANRAKKIEIKQVENEPIYHQPPRQYLPPSISQKEPIRIFGQSKTNAPGGNLSRPHSALMDKNSRPATIQRPLPNQSLRRDENFPIHSAGVKKPTKPPLLDTRKREMSSMSIADIVERKVEEILAARALNEKAHPPPQDMNEEVNKRLELLEKKLEKKADARAEGLTYILLAKQHNARGEYFSALKMYELALSYFPENPKLMRKITDLKEKRAQESSSSSSASSTPNIPLFSAEIYPKDEPIPRPKIKKAFAVFMDTDEPTTGEVNSTYPPEPEPEYEYEDNEYEHNGDEEWAPDMGQTPRTKELLRIVNSEDVGAIMKLKGIGKKRAEALAQHVKSKREAMCDEDFPAIRDLEELGVIKGISSHMVENMKSGLMV